MFLPCLVSRPHYFGRPIYILSGYHGCKSPHKVSYRQGCISQLIQQIQGGITSSPTQCSITSDRSATRGKARFIAQPERKPCKPLTIITTCHLPEMKPSSLERGYWPLQDERWIKSFAVSTSFLVFMKGQTFVSGFLRKSRNIFCNVLLVSQEYVY